MTTKTEIQESPENEYKLLSSEERAILSQISTKEPPYSSRAQALLAIDEGTTQVEAGRQAGLTKGQVRYWLGKFRKDGSSIFPEELLNQAQPEDAGEEEAQPELPVAEETAGPVDKAAAQQEDMPKAKKKSKKKSKKAKKSEKIKKPKKDKKAKKGKKSTKKTKKKGSKKVKGAKGKSSKKTKKKSKK